MKLMVRSRSTTRRRVNEAPAWRLGFIAISLIVYLYHAVADELRQLGEIALADTTGNRRRQRRQRAGGYRHRHARRCAGCDRRHQVLAQGAKIERDVGLFALQHRDLGGKPAGRGRRLLEHVEHLIERETLLDAERER